MPYSYPDNIPDYIENLPTGAQKLFVAAFNSVFEETQDEDKARIAGWGAVKTRYEEQEDKWVRKAKEVSSMIDLTEVDTVQKAYALHNKVHSDYVDPRWGHKRKADIQKDHEAIVNLILELGGRHIPKGDALDDTLPQELKEAMRLRYLGDSIELSDGEHPQSKIQVLRVGTFHHPVYGKFEITDETLGSMIKNFKAKKPAPPTEMVVDYEHMGTADPPVKAPAAGWVKGLETDDGGLFALVEWTDDAVKEIKGKQYRFISPEFDLNYQDKDTGKRIGPTLISITLTNRPFIEGMQPVVLSEALGSMIFNEEVKMAEWDAQYINNLPDDCFAYIKPDGEKDDEGKTVPRALRYLPYKNSSGEVDLPHLRNALARLDQTELSPEEQAKARKVLIDAAQEAGVGDYSELPGVTESEWKEATMEETKLREALGVGADADLMKEAQAIKAKAEEAITLKTQVDELTTELATAKESAENATKKLSDAEAEKAVDTAIASGKLLPKMKQWATDYVLRDPTGFTAFLEMVEKVGPDLTIRGSDAAGTGVTAEPTEKELEVAARLGVSTEDLVKAKEAEAKKGVKGK